MARQHSTTYVIASSPPCMGFSSGLANPLLQYSHTNSFLLCRKLWLSTLMSVWVTRKMIVGAFLRNVLWTERVVFSLVCLCASPRAARHSKHAAANSPSKGASWQVSSINSPRVRNIVRDPQLDAVLLYNDCSYNFIPHFPGKSLSLCAIESCNRVYRPAVWVGLPCNQTE